MRLFLLALLLSGCYRHYVVRDLGPNTDHMNDFRCLGWCQERQHMYDVAISDDRRFCYCRPDDKVSD